MKGFKYYLSRIKNTPVVSVLSNLLLLYVIYTILRLAFFLVNIDLFRDVEAADLWRMCLGGLRFDTTSLMYLNSLYMVMALLPFRFREASVYKICTKCVFLICNIVGILVNCFDIISFHFVNRRVTTSFFSEFKNDSNLFSIGIQGCIEYWYVTLLSIALIVALIFLYRNLHDVKSPENKLVYYPVHTLVLCLTVFLVIGGIRGGYSVTIRPLSFQNANAYVNKPHETAIVLNSAFTLMMSLDTKTYSNPGYFTDKDELIKYCNPHHYPSPDGEFKYDNVVIIILESFAREYVGTFYSDLDGGTYKGYTPFLDSLISKSLSFDYTFATGKKSIDALPSVLCGIPSIIDPFVTTQYANDEVGSLAKCLRTKGYETAFFHGAPNGSIGLDAFANSAGIEKYYGLNEYGNMADFDGIWAIYDEEFLQYFANGLSKMNKPFLGIVFTASSHHPYRLPERYKGVFKQGPDPMYESIGYSDYALKKFFETASKTDWYKNTLFVITADHTTVITRPDFINGRGFMDIPIFFFHPGDSTMVGRVDRVVGQTDITPSVLGYLNYDEPYFAFGKDIFDKRDTTDFVINYYDLSYQIFKDSLMLQFDGDKTTGLFNYRKDRGLNNNIMGFCPQQLEMEKYLKAEIQTYIECVTKDSLTIK
ncbi:MAG: LTA synthase family protein [Paludibacteraceae bacterium]|nr:LTA synthase family protein [Paludibacteraceae bacterium]